MLRCGPACLFLSLLAGCVHLEPGAVSPVQVSSQHEGEVASWGSYTLATTREGRSWEAPASWAEAVRQGLGEERSRPVEARSLRLALDYATRAQVLSHVVHVLTVALFPRFTEHRLTLTASVLAGEELVWKGRVEGSAHASAGLGLVFYPPGWGGWNLPLAEHPALLNVIQRLVLRVVEEIPRGLPPPAEAPRSSCPSCERQVAAGWVACPYCGTRLGD